MPNLRTKNVFIDTEAFDAANLNFDSTVFSELVRLAHAGFAKVFLTTITKREIQTHITEKVHEATASLMRFRKEGRVLKNVSACAPFFADFREYAAEDEMQKSFRTFLDIAGVTVLNLDDADAKSIFKDYFAKRPPFGEGRKKEEFPDAFAQQLLRKWCEKNDEKMYVVSRDQDWQGVNDPLIPITKLQEFIDLAVKDQAGNELPSNVLKRYDLHLDMVAIAVREAFKASGFFTDDVDGDVEDVEIRQLALGEPFVLEVDEGSATLLVTVDIDYEANVSYLDDNEGIWDSEDHEWSYRPTKDTEVEESASFDAELFVEFDPSDKNTFDVSCTIGRDFRVTVLPTDYELK